MCLIHSMAARNLEGISCGCFHDQLSFGSMISKLIAYRITRLFRIYMSILNHLVNPV